METLYTIATSARSSQLPVDIGGDHNAWAELEVSNTRTQTTYAEGDKSSIVDLPFVDPKLMGDRIVRMVSHCYMDSNYYASCTTCKVQKVE